MNKEKALKNQGLEFREDIFYLRETLGRRIFCKLWEIVAMIL